MLRHRRGSKLGMIHWLDSNGYGYKIIGWIKVEMFVGASKSAIRINISEWWIHKKVEECMHDHLRDLGRDFVDHATLSSYGFWILQI